MATSQCIQHETTSPYKRRFINIAYCNTCKILSNQYLLPTDHRAIISFIWKLVISLFHKNIRSVRNLHAKIYRSIWHWTYYDVTDKNNNVSSEGLDRHYHKYPSSSYRTNCLYSIYIWDFQIYWLISS